MVSKRASATTTPPDSTTSTNVAGVGHQFEAMTGRQRPVFRARGAVAQMPSPGVGGVGTATPGSARWVSARRPLRVRRPLPGGA